jgi:hypothetical protein
MKTVIASILFSLLTATAFSQSTISGQCDSSGHIRLDWSAAKGTIISTFTVQQSVDGSTWFSIATIRAGNPASATAYSYSSNAENGPVMWFRLLQEDSFGRRIFSNVILVRSL